MIHVRSLESDTSPVDLGSYSSRNVHECQCCHPSSTRYAKSCSMLLGKCWAIILTCWFLTISIYYKHDPAVGVSSWKHCIRPKRTKAHYFKRCLSFTSMGGVHKGAATGLAPAYSFSAYVAEVDVDATGLVSSPTYGLYMTVEKHSIHWQLKDKSSVLVTWDLARCSLKRWSMGALDICKIQTSSNTKFRQFTKYHVTQSLLNHLILKAHSGQGNWRRPSLATSRCC